MNIAYQRGISSQCNPYRNGMWIDDISTVPLGVRFAPLFPHCTVYESSALESIFQSYFIILQQNLSYGKDVLSLYPR